MKRHLVNNFLLIVVAAAVIFVVQIFYSSPTQAHSVHSAGFVQTVPDGYALVGIGYGSDDHRCFVYIKEGRLNPDGTITNMGWRTKSCDKGGGDDSPFAAFVPAGNFLTGWSWNSNGHTTGGKGWKEGSYDNNSPSQICYFQAYRQIDPSTQKLIGPVLGWGSASDGTCSERGYAPWDLKIIAYVSDIPDACSGAQTCVPNGFPTVSGETDRVITNIMLDLADDGSVSQPVFVTYRTPPSAIWEANSTSDNIPTIFNQGQTVSDLTITMRNDGSIWNSDSGRDVAGTGSGKCEIDTDADGINNCPNPNDTTNLVGDVCTIQRTNWSSSIRLQKQSGGLFTPNLSILNYDKRNTQTCSLAPGTRYCSNSRSYCQNLEFICESSFGECSTGGCGDEESCEASEFSLPFGCGGTWERACNGSWDPDPKITSISETDPNVNGGESVSFPNPIIDSPPPILLELTAPSISGYYLETWQMVRNPSFGTPLSKTLIVQGQGNIQVNSVNSETGDPVSSTWDFIGFPDTYPCDAGCTGDSKTYPNQSTGDYTLRAINDSAGLLYTFKGIDIKQVSSDEGKFAFGFLRTWLGKLVKAVNVAPCINSNLCTLPLGDSETITFTAQWLPEATLNVSPVTLPTLNAVVGGSNPSGTVSVSNNGAPGSTLDWSVSAVSDPSLIISPTVGPGGTGIIVGGSQDVTITADINGLVAGTYNGTTVTFEGTSQSSGGPLSAPPVTVDLTVNNPSSITITSLSPDKAVEGDPSFPLIVTGSGFVSNSVVQWSGFTDLTPTSVTPIQITVSVPSSYIASIGTFPITVFSPAPGGGTSNLVTFTVNAIPGADIKANGSDGPPPIPYNTSATITWTSTDATSCSVSPTGWTGTSGSQSTGNLTSSQTYDLSCSGPGGTSLDSVVVNVEANFAPNPPGDPEDDPDGTPDAISPGTQSGGYCTNNNFWRISWAYSDPEGDLQDAYEVEVDNNSDFSSPEIDTGQVTSPSTEYITSGLSYNNTTYYYRVRVWDDQGNISGWSSTDSFATVNNAYPAPSFNWSPSSPPAGVIVDFTDSSACFDSSGGSAACIGWDWDFDDGNTSTEQHPKNIFNATSSYTVILTSTDSSGFSCEAQNIIDIGKEVQLPEWKEVSPAQ